MGDNHSNGTTADTLKALEAEREDLESAVASVRQMTRDFDALTKQEESFDPERIALSLKLKGPQYNRCVWKGFTTPEAFQWHKEAMAKQKALGEQLLRDAAAFGQALVARAEDLERRGKDYRARAQQQKEPALLPSPSVPIVTGENGLMPGELGYSAPQANESPEELIRKAVEPEKRGQGPISKDDQPKTAGEEIPASTESLAVSPSEPIAQAQPAPTPNPLVVAPGDSEGTGTFENPTPAPNQGLTASPGEPEAHAQALPTPDPQALLPRESEANHYASSANNSANAIDAQGLPEIWPTQEILNDFLHGRGPSHYSFYSGEPWTEAMKLNPAVAAARYAIQQKLIANDKAGVWQDQGRVDYDLSHYYTTLGLLLDLLRNVSWWVTNGNGGQNDWSVNGSFRGTWTANILTPTIAEVHFHLTDALTASSMTHISYGGTIHSILPNNPLGPNGPLSNVDIEWLWGWQVNYQLNGLYILEEYKQ